MFKKTFLIAGFTLISATLILGWIFGTRKSASYYVTKQKILKGRTLTFLNKNSAYDLRNISHHLVHKSKIYLGTQDDCTWSNNTISHSELISAGEKPCLFKNNIFFNVSIDPAFLNAQFLKDNECLLCR